VFIYNICDHEEAYREVGSQASLHHGRSGHDRRQDDAHRRLGGAGVFNMEQLDPDPFMAALGVQACPGRPEL
jgi:saccharopine dehydrogenase (NAD+, L-lysine-forming)